MNFMLDVPFHSSFLLLRSLTFSHQLSFPPTPSYTSHLKTTCAATPLPPCLALSASSSQMTSTTVEALMKMDQKETSPSLTTLNPRMKIISEESRGLFQTLPKFVQLLYTSRVFLMDAFPRQAVDVAVTNAFDNKLQLEREKNLPLTRAIELLEAKVDALVPRIDALLAAKVVTPIEVAPLHHEVPAKPFKEVSDVVFY